MYTTTITYMYNVKIRRYMHTYMYIYTLLQCGNTNFISSPPLKMQEVGDTIGTAWDRVQHRCRHD